MKEEVVDLKTRIQDYLGLVKQIEDSKKELEADQVEFSETVEAIVHEVRALIGNSMNGSLVVVKDGKSYLLTLWQGSLLPLEEINIIT